MHSNKKGFAFGLAGTILGTIITGISLLLTFFLLLALSISKNTQLANILTIFQYLNIAAIIISIVALCLSNKKPKISAILMLISAILYSLMFADLIILSQLKESAYWILLGFVPTILFITSAIFSFKNKQV